MKAEKCGETMCGIQDRIFDMTENALAGFNILIGMIVEREKMMMQKKRDYCQSSPLLG